MKFFLTTILISISFFAFSQGTQKVDSAQKKIEKYYNIEITDSQRTAYKKHISDLTKFINYDSTKAGAYLNRGVYYSFLGLFVKAIEDYDKAIAIDDSMAIAYYNRGIAKSRFVNSREACMDYRKAYKLGLDQAKDVYDSACALHNRSIIAAEKKKQQN